MKVCSFVKNKIMGFFDRYKSTRKEEETKIISWNKLNSIEQLDALVEESGTKLVGIFKHSTRCGVSRGVLKSFERQFQLSEDQVKLYFLDLLENRDVSNEIANRFKVRHESPQLILIKNGEAVYHNSHSSIDASKLDRFI